MSIRKVWAFGAVTCLVLGCAAKEGEGEEGALDADAGGPETIETRVDEPPGANCEYGGIAVLNGVDRNDDGELRGREIRDTRYECDDESVLESRLLITDLEVGDPDCPGGGTRMDRGVDQNQNGELDPDEIETTDFLCNPEVEPESRLIITALDVGDADCPGGGSRLERGADLDGDGEIRGGEIESTDLICNDVQAPPVLARADELEEGDEDCPNGGVAVLTGADVDGDGLLSDEEATERSLVCNDPELVIQCPVPYVWNEERSGCVLEDDWSEADLTGSDLSNVYLAGIDFTGANLSGADLSNTELRDANLSGANLSGANLSGTSLEGTNLSGAQLKGADLTGVDLSQAVLEEVSAIELAACPELLPEGWRCSDFGASGLVLTWPGMSLDGLDLTGAELGLEDLYGLQPFGILGCPASLPDAWVCTELGDLGLSLVGSGASFDALDLSGADLGEATNLSYTSFEGTNLADATFAPGTDFSGATFMDADLSGATFGAGSSFDGTVIKATDLSGVDWSGQNLAGIHAVNLTACPAALPEAWSCVSSASGWVLVGPGADLSGVDLNGADLANANLSGVNLTYGSVEGATLTGANLSGATLTMTHGHAFIGCPATLPGGFVCAEDVLLGPQIDLHGVDLSNRTFDDVNLSGANLSGANLSGTILQGSNLAYADLSYTNLTGTDLRGSDLTGASLFGATVVETLTGEALWGQTECPDGSISGVGYEQGCFDD